MTEYLLVLILVCSDGNKGALTTVKVPDRESCYKVGREFVDGRVGVNAPRFTCTEIIKE